MSIKQVIVGLCVTAAALTGVVTTVSAAGSEAGFAVRTTSLSGGPTAALTVGAAAAGSVNAGSMQRQGDLPQTGFDATSLDEEALPASSLYLLLLAALLAIGSLMMRRRS